MQVVHDPEQLQFYDFWVARDANGAPLSNVKPFVHHTYSLQRLDQGLPFPVSCCWNGMLSMNAEPFTHHSLRFRSAPERAATDKCEDGLAGAWLQVFFITACCRGLQQGSCLMGTSIWQMTGTVLVWQGRERPDPSLRLLAEVRGRVNAQNARPQTCAGTS